MASEILMPKLGATMESGTILRWYKKEGEAIRKGDPLVEIETDKVSMDFESPVSGKVLKILAAADDVVGVQQLIAYIGEAGDVLETPPFTVHKAHVANLIAEEKGELERRQETGFTTKIRATPAARKIARMEGIQLECAQGTGPLGRIQVIDVKNFVRQLTQSQRVTPLAQKVANKEGISLDLITGTGVEGKIRKHDVLHIVEAGLPAIAAEGERIKIEGMRKVIAQRMVQSATTVPHVTLTTEVDMSAAMEMRKALLPLIEKKTGLRVSYTEIIMKAVSRALALHPRVNASLQGDYIISNPHVNLGLAVAISNGLVVPVVKQTEQKGLVELTVDCKQLVNLAREGKLLPDHMSNGTFTISNLGMYAIDAFTPIINLPEIAILGVGRINEKVVGVEGRIELRPIMTLSLSFDHRVIDGAPAAEFLTELKGALENPLVLMV